MSRLDDINRFLWSSYISSKRRSGLSTLFGEALVLVGSESSPETFDGRVLDVLVGLGVRQKRYIGAVFDRSVWWAVWKGDASEHWRRCHPSVAWGVYFGRQWSGGTCLSTSFGPPPCAEIGHAPSDSRHRLVE